LGELLGNETWVIEGGRQAGQRCLRDDAFAPQLGQVDGPRPISTCGSTTVIARLAPRFRASRASVVPVLRLAGAQRLKRGLCPGVEPVAACSPVAGYCGGLEAEDGEVVFGKSRQPASPARLWSVELTQSAARDASE